MPAAEKVLTSVEIPFSHGTQRILQSAAAEAERLGHTYIGTVHLLLGILSESDTVAAQVLVGKGIDLESAADLEPFLQLVQKYHRPGWIYRGVGDSSFTLLPKVGRLEFRPQYSLKTEGLLLRTFKQRAVRHVNLATHL